MAKTKKYISVKKKKGVGTQNLAKYREKLRIAVSQQNDEEMVREVMTSENVVTDDVTHFNEAVFPDEFSDTDLFCSETMPDSPIISPIDDCELTEVLENTRESVSIELATESNVVEDFDPDLPLKQTVGDAQAEQSSPLELTGRRIIDVQHFLNSIADIAIHAPFDCTFADMSPISESRTGFITTITFKCRMCNLVKSVTSEKSSSGPSSVNASLVSGIMSTGGGFSQLAEISASIDMPCMAKETWQKYHRLVSDTYHEISREQMLEAGREEARLAREASDVDEDGYPCIAVVADGSWAKRSYRTKYDSSSGVAAIVGFQTKKVLFIGVRNKYCSMCDRKGGDTDASVGEHRCAKNWTGSSTAMEADIIVEGFKCSVEMHGIKYTKLIGDGDSSVHRRLIDALPYGPEALVQKIECRNHALRCYGNRMRDLCTNRKVGTVILRNNLRKNLKRLRYAVTSAIRHRKAQVDQPRYVRVEELRKDIKNGPSHVFGEHGRCAERGYFCDGNPKPGEVNLVEDMKLTGVFQEIQSAMHRLVEHASSLIWDVDNNVAELYNSQVAKAIGGKRVNFALRESYGARCDSAVVRMNSGGQFHVLVQEKLTGTAGKFTKLYCDKKSGSLSIRKRGFKGKKKIFATQTADADYGPDAACPQQSDMSAEDLASAQKAFVQALYSEDLPEIAQRTMGQSSSTEWYEHRRKRLTASVFGEICKRRPRTPCAKLVERIRYSDFHGNSNTRWGIEKEPLAISQFSAEYSVTVDNSGLVVDEVLPFLAASPDGLVGNDAVVEVKCPASAKDLTPMEGIESKKIKFMTIKDGKATLTSSHNYMYQVQGLLHITNRKCCYFVVWTPKGLVCDKIKRDDKFWTEKMENKLSDFFHDCLLPEIVDSRRARQLPIREPTHIIEAQKAPRKKK